MLVAVLLTQSHAVSLGDPRTPFLALGNWCPPGRCFTQPKGCPTTATVPCGSGLDSNVPYQSYDYEFPAHFDAGYYGGSLSFLDQALEPRPSWHSDRPATISLTMEGVTYYGFDLNGLTLQLEAYNCADHPPHGCRDFPECGPAASKYFTIKGTRPSQPDVEVVFEAECTNSGCGFPGFERDNPDGVVTFGDTFKKVEKIEFSSFCVFPSISSVQLTVAKVWDCDCSWTANGCGADDGSPCWKQCCGSGCDCSHTQNGCGQVDGTRCWNVCCGGLGGTQFYTGEKGSVCPSSDHISNIDSCHDGHSELGLTHDGQWIGAHTRIPRSCSFKPLTSAGHFHFNHASSGQGRKDLMPVCIRQSPYYVGELGGQCPEIDLITNIDDCRSAHVFLGLKEPAGVDPGNTYGHQWIGTLPSIPKGCSFKPLESNGHLHYNYASRGQGRHDLQPVCRRQ